jgi:alkylation response protein AidB-like acyl-CoA dehydrogenase
MDATDAPAWADSPAEAAFRLAAREWLCAHVPSAPLPSMDTREGFEAHREWERTLSDARWSVVHWPERFGGRGVDLLHWLVFEEEYYAADAPGRVSQNGIFLLGPTLFEFGTHEQQQRYLPRMAAGEDIWAQGWSEPDSGSDLASLRTRAERVDGGWRVTGQKTWCSRAAYADMLFALVRTDPASQRHHGLSYLLLPLTADGVTVRPIRQLDGEAGFAEVFLDDVFVPDHDVIGAVDEGWRAAMSTSSNERGMSLRSPARFLAPAERLVEKWKADRDPAFADRVADAWIKAQAYRLHTFGTVTRLANGGELGAESSVTKVFWSDLDVALHQTALDMRGADGELADHWTDGLLFALGGPIYAGTNEIQRNIIAERLLGLPREPK